MKSILPINSNSVTSFFLRFLPIFFLSLLLLSFQPTPSEIGSLSNLPSKTSVSLTGFPNLKNTFSLFNAYYLKTRQNKNPSRYNYELIKKENPQQAEKAAKYITTIVLDPGHGAENVGAQGHTGLLEKDVALDISRILKNMLVQRLNLTVQLTRNSDTYVPIVHRVEKANNQKADLFISIHTNGSRRSAARGAECYFLSYEAVDQDAQELADIENLGWTIESAAEQVNEDLQLVLWHMAQAEYLSESSTLAELIQQELNEVLDVKERGIKQAPLLVLMGAQMPAVLVEVAFITNPYEERMLKNRAFKVKIAEALYQGIYNYIQLYNDRMSGAVNERN